MGFLPGHLFSCPGKRAHKNQLLSVASVPQVTSGNGREASWFRASLARGTPVQSRLQRVLPLAALHGAGRASREGIPVASGVRIVVPLTGRNQFVFRHF